jgi:hypothetical protein
MEHDRSPLAAYALGALDDGEKRTVDAHLAACAECRAELDDFAVLEAALGEVPPEAFFEGPPEGGDLLLQRTLRAVRGERSRAARPRRLLVAAGVAALVAASLGGGVLMGRGTAPTVQAGGASSASASSSASGPAARTASGKDPKTGAAMTVALTPAAGWVRVHVKVDGVPAGKRCVLQVVPRRGAPVVAGSWLVSATGEKNGTTLDGAALVAPNDVASVDVVTTDGQKLVSVPV